MGGTSSGGIATVATSMNQKPIKRVSEDDWSVADAEDEWNDGIHYAYMKGGDEGVAQFRKEMAAKGIKDPNIGDR